jgi:hypothetical protein
MGAFWDIAPCSLGVDRRFNGVYCIRRQGDVFSNENTRRYIPENSRHHIRLRESLKSHVLLNFMKIQLKFRIFGQFCVLTEGQSSIPPFSSYEWNDRL